MHPSRLRGSSLTVVLACLSIVVIAACSTGTPATIASAVPTAQPSTPTATGNVKGIATAGPVCPVARAGDPACLSRPVAGATLVVTTVDGSEVARATTGADGRFAIGLPAGDYILVPQPFKGLIGPARPVPFSVGSDGTTMPDQLVAEYDTGIR
jgi:Carboxypeptidase regulatory-like domain